MSLLFNLLLAPTINVLTREPPISSYSEPRQFSLAQQPVDGLEMNMQKLSDFLNGHNGR